MVQTFLLCAILVSPTCQAAEEALAKDVSPKTLTGEHWRPVGTSIETRKLKAKANCSVTLPRQARIELLVSSVAGVPAFEFSFGPARVPLTIETWDDTLVGLCGEEFIEIGLVTMPNQWLGMGLDQQKKELTFFDQDGKSLGTLKGFTEIRKPNLTVSNHGEHLAVEKIRVSEWDGQPIRRTREKRLIYEGPDGGRGWTFNESSAGKGQLSTWSSVSGGGMTSTSSGSAFRSISKLPRNFELRVGLAGLAENKHLRDRVRLKLGWWSSVLLDRDEFWVNMSDGFLRVKRDQFDESPEPVAFPESRQGGVVLRVFVKQLKDEKCFEYSFRAADGRLLSRVKGDSAKGIPPKAGIALSPNRGLVISSVQVLEWDGESEPEVIPGG